MTGSYDVGFRSIIGEKNTTPMENNEQYKFAQDNDNSNCWMMITDTDGCHNQASFLLPHQGSLNTMTAVNQFEERQEVGSQFHGLEEWQVSTSNPMHLLEWTGGENLAYQTDSERISFFHLNDVHQVEHFNAGEIQNSPAIGLGQRLQGSSQMAALSDIGSYPKSSSYGDSSEEDIITSHSLKHPLQDEVMPDQNILGEDCAVVTIQYASSVDRSTVASEDGDDSNCPNQSPISFIISYISPNWAYAGEKSEVTIIGKFLRSPEEVQKCEWACMFGEMKVCAEFVMDGVLRCQTPSHASGNVQLYVACSNGFQCSEVREFEFRAKVVDLGDVGSIETHLYIIRFRKLLSLESSNSRIPIESFSTETLELCTKISKLLEDNSEWEELENFTMLVKLPSNNAKHEVLQKLLKKQLRVWLLQKIAEGGRGGNTLDNDGQGVLHLAAALGYNWAIQPILAAGVSIDFRDVNGWTALDWASSKSRYDMMKLLSSLGGTSGLMRVPTTTYPSAVNSDIDQIYSEAKLDWLPPPMIHKILLNREQFPIEQELRNRPPSGSFFLYDRNVLPHYRKDGYRWCKKNGKLVESHVKLKVGVSAFLSGYYARGEENKDFYRRSYWMIERLSNIVLVHYLEVKAANFGSKHLSNSRGGHNSDDNPNSGTKRSNYSHWGQTSANQATKQNDVNQVELSNAGGLQNSYLTGPAGRLLLQDDLQLSTITASEISSESSLDENLGVEDKDDYPSLQEPIQDGVTRDNFEMIDRLDCWINELADVTGKTIQPCSSVYRGTARSEDGDEGDIPSHIEDVDIADESSITYDKALFHMRFENMLSLELGTSETPVHSSSDETSQLYRKISAMLEGDLEWDQMGNLTKQDEFSQAIGKDQILQRSLKEKLRTWLLKRITGDGKGLSILDEGGQGVLHFVAALGYDWAILPTLTAGISINFEDANGWTALHWAEFTGRERTMGLLISLGAALGLGTDLASSSGHNSIFGYPAEFSLTSHISSITLQDSSRSRSHGEKAVVTISKQSATPVGYDDYEFGVSDNHALSLMPLRTNESGLDSEPGHAAAVQIQNKFRSWKGRKDFLLIRQQIIKIQAHLRGHQVRENYRKATKPVGIIRKIFEWTFPWRQIARELIGFQFIRLSLARPRSSITLSETQDAHDYLDGGIQQMQVQQRVTQPPYLNLDGLKQAHEGSTKEKKPWSMPGMFFPDTSAKIPARMRKPVLREHGFEEVDSSGRPSIGPTNLARQVVVLLLLLLVLSVFSSTPLDQVWHGLLLLLLLCISVLQFFSYSCQVTSNENN